MRGRRGAAAAHSAVGCRALQPAAQRAGILTRPASLQAKDRAQRATWIPGAACGRLWPAAATSSAASAPTAMARPATSADSFAGCKAVWAPGRSPGWFPDQAVAAGLLRWRGRRWRGAPAATVVDAGLRPRFFSVLPTPANFRSR
jgi:hypothetical protein